MTCMTGPSTTSSQATLTDGPLLRPDQAAHLLSVKTSWVYEAVRAGRVPCVRVGQHIRFTRAMLEAWLAEQGGPAEELSRPTSSTTTLILSRALPDRLRCC